MAYIAIRDEKGEKKVVDYAEYEEEIKPKMKEQMAKEHSKTKKKEGTIEIPIKKLQKIAEYYEFPFAVFFMPENEIPEGTTRNEALAKKAEAFDKVIEVIEEIEDERNKT